MQKTIVVFIVNLLFVSAAFAQNMPDSQYKPASILFVVKDTSNAKQVISKYSLPGNFYSIHLGFFCRQELQVQKTLKLPVYFRVGSLEACNKMEGKLQ